MRAAYGSEADVSRRRPEDLVRPNSDIMRLDKSVPIPTEPRPAEAWGARARPFNGNDELTETPKDVVQVANLFQNMESLNPRSQSAKDGIHFKPRQIQANRFGRRDVDPGDVWIVDEPICACSRRLTGDIGRNKPPCDRSHFT